MTDWRDRAACLNSDPDIWFPSKGAPSGAALALCRRCPVVEECLEFALSVSPPPDGIWGGTTERQRRPLRARRMSNVG